MKDIIHKCSDGTFVKEVLGEGCRGCYCNDGPCNAREIGLPDCVFGRKGNSVKYIAVSTQRPHFLLDMDGCLADFLSSAIEELNKAYGKDITLEQYAKEFGQWGTYDYYGITVAEFWEPINDKWNFWLDLEPMPWAKKLYTALSAIGDVTVVTAPSQDPDCARQKLQWLHFHLGIKPEAVFLGHRKYLMAGNGILIDDYHKNVDTFREAGGQAILIPSTWNKYDTNFEEIWDIITKSL